MKTIREIAEEIGVTKQAVFYRISKPPLSLALQSLVTKENGILMIPFDAEILIKQAFNMPVIVKKPSKGSEKIAMLCNVTDGLLAQLRQKDRQIAELTTIIKTLSKAKFQKRKKPVKQKQTRPKIEKLLNQK
ncbi:MAG: hypothetical protein FWC77_03290 [Defluviitaleaceae bacterium]|nr:hypothetical protein [Defluviitaleaceae bacterium]